MMLNRDRERRDRNEYARLSNSKPWAGMLMIIGVVLDAIAFASSYANVVGTLAAVGLSMVAIGAGWFWSIRKDLRDLSAASAARRDN